MKPVDFSSSFPFCFFVLFTSIILSFSEYVTIKRVGCLCWIWYKTKKQKEEKGDGGVFCCCCHQITENRRIRAGWQTWNTAALLTLYYSISVERKRRRCLPIFSLFIFFCCSRHWFFDFLNLDFLFLGFFLILD